jgi:hypothetical protein
MRGIESENWVHQLVRRIDQGERVEDRVVELKADWIEARKAVRRLAAHANAAFGESVLWVIGLDERIGVRPVNPPIWRSGSHRCRRSSTALLPRCRTK